MEETNLSISASSIKDNQARGSVGQFLIDNIKTDAELSFVSAYFTIYAYNHLRGQLGDIKRLRFLFGEPTFIKSLDPSKTKKRDFKIEDNNIVIPTNSRLTQKSIAKECSDWIREKVEIKSMVKPNFLHGKLYMVENTNGVKEGAMGSSNFTVNGLGLGGSPNIELNMVIQDKRDLVDLKLWFTELWDNNKGLVEDVKEQVLTYLEQLYIDNEPEFIYYKTLFHVFGKFLSDQDKGGLLNEKLGFYDSEIWNMLYEFQKDGVKGAINKILKFNGCIIADSVGLGKTFEALAVIRYFELLNQRVLVLCPKKLSENWTIYQASKNNTLNPFRKDRFNVNALAVSGTNIFAGSDSGVFVTYDNGLLWHSMNTGLTDKAIYSLAIYGTDLYAGTATQGVWKRALSEMVSGIPEVSEGNKINVYPNPSNDLFNVESGTNISSIEILNVLGEKIYTSTVNSDKAEINLSNEPKGIYFYKIVTEEKDITNGKLIVE